ncbi:hypothetical protein GGR53DRAFT_515199 [Hypoxylon sp. FL1150]|nr:hypothetical protein GGR53DRAFT_515199 [Hypoxylon sp. FL1150]
MSISHPHQPNLRNVDTSSQVNSNSQQTSRTRSPVAGSLQVPDTKLPPETTKPLEQNSDLLSEFHFPQPPSSRPSSRAAHSATQGSRPSSPLPPLHPSPLSIYPPQDTSPASKKGAPRARSHDSLCSPRSEVDIQTLSQLKPLPARPPPDVEVEEGDEMMKGKQHLFHFKRTDASVATEVETARSISLVGRTGSGKGHHAVTTVETKPPISSEKQHGAKDGVTENEIHSLQHQRAVSESRLDTRAPQEAPKLEERRPLHKQGLTPEEIIWLHKNYRGEATFLKAWGLHFTRDADREQGREILQVLMAAELQKAEKSTCDNVEGKHAPSGDGAGLRVIQEATATNFTT